MVGDEDLVLPRLAIQRVLGHVVGAVNDTADQVTGEPIAAHADQVGKLHAFGVDVELIREDIVQDGLAVAPSHQRQSA